MLSETEAPRGSGPGGRPEEARVGLSPWILRLILVVSIGVGCALRLTELDDAFFQEDEFHSLRTSRHTYSELVQHYDRKGGGIAFSLLVKASGDLFDP
ncbi:MAG: hypothetical protein ACRD1Z_07440, partial [Vicinamibacteria bacterium]